MTYKLSCHEHKHVTPNDIQLGFTLDLSGNFKFIDTAGEQILGYRCEELRRTSLDQLVPLEFAEFVRRQIARAGTGNPGAVYEIEIIAKNRRRVRLEISTRLVMHDGCPFELKGIALVRGQVATSPPKCLDEQFTLNFGDGTLRLFDILVAR